MKCDVCGTKIPLGHHECPNCGYKLNGKYASVYDASSVNHEHIRGTEKRKSYIPPKVNIEFAKQLSLGQNKYSTLITVFVVILFIIGLMLMVVPRYMNQMNPSNRMTFEEAINEGYDNDGTIEYALSQEDEVFSYLSSLGFQNVSIDEYLDNEYGDVTIVLYGDYDKEGYSLQFSYNQNTCVERYMSMSFQSEVGLRRSGELVINKEIFNQISEYMGVGETTQSIETMIPQMILMEKRDHDDPTKYNYTIEGNPYISITEDYYSDTNIYYNNVSMLKQV